MKNIVDQLIEKIKEKDNPTVMGLDPIPDYIPEEISKNNVNIADNFLRFNKTLIDSVHDIIPAVKPNLAFYEVYGYEGIRAFMETCRYAHQKGMIVIADGKRNDIGSTGEAYAKAYFGNTYNVDLLTVNAYLGEDRSSSISKSK